MARRIGFLEMAEYVERVLEIMDHNGDLIHDTFDLDTVLAADRRARIITNEAIALKQAS